MFIRKGEEMVVLLPVETELTVTLARGGIACEHIVHTSVSQHMRVSIVDLGTHKFTFMHSL